MPLPPQKFREMVFQLLYSRLFGASEPADMVPMLMAELRVTKNSVCKAVQRAEAIEAHFDQLDPQIASASPNYRFERISGVEKTILRLALYELLHDPTLPSRVAMAEAMRLTRKFGTPESAKFVTAILDVIHCSQKDAAANPSTPL